MELWLKDFPKKDAQKVDDTVLQMRLFLPMINEAARILEEGLVKNAGTVDLGMIFGTGFPPFRGGLLKYADNEGLENILKEIEQFAASVSAERFEAAPLLKKLAQEKKTFYEFSH